MLSSLWNPALGKEEQEGCVSSLVHSNLEMPPLAKGRESWAWSCMSGSPLLTAERVRGEHPVSLWNAQVLGVIQTGARGKHGKDTANLEAGFVFSSAPIKRAT